MTESIWIAFIGLLSAGLGTFTGVLLGRRKLKAEASQILADAAVSLVEPLKDRLDAVEAELESEKEINRLYRRTLEEWREGFEILDCQMKEAKLEPNWRPPPMSDIPTRPRRDRKK